MSAPRPAKAGRPPWGTSKVAKPHLLVRGWRFAGRVPLRLRVFFRGVFALLALAMVALALSVLQDEKQRSHRVYAEGLQRNQAQIAARLRHPTGRARPARPGVVRRPHLHGQDGRNHQRVQCRWRRGVHAHAAAAGAVIKRQCSAREVATRHARGTRMAGSASSMPLPMPPRHEQAKSASGVEHTLRIVSIRCRRRSVPFCMQRPSESPDREDPLH